MSWARWVVVVCVSASLALAGCASTGRTTPASQSTGVTTETLSTGAHVATVREAGLEFAITLPVTVVTLGERIDTNLSIRNISETALDVRDHQIRVTFNEKATGRSLGALQYPETYFSPARPLRLESGESTEVVMSFDTADWSSAPVYSDILTRRPLDISVRGSFSPPFLQTPAIAVVVR